MAYTVGGMEIPETRYARSGEISIAYQVYGSGNVDVVTVPGAGSNVDLVWAWSGHHHYYERWGSFARMAHFDKRGTGLSDRLDRPASIEERIDDIRVVMDAAGFDRATLFGVSEGGPLAMLFAATYPERVESLILQGTFPGGFSDPTSSFYMDRVNYEAFVDLWAENWGTPETITLELMMPSQIGDPEFVKAINRYERASVTPAALKRLMTMNYDLDVRHVLGTIRCPTLVLHARGDRLVPITSGRWIAEHIPGARFFEYDSSDHVPFYVGCNEQLDAIEAFLTGDVRAPQTDRVLATVLFMDVVGSTQHLVQMGDDRWAALIERHDVDRRDVVARHRGCVVHTAGDGFLATFDSPARAIRCAQEIHLRARTSNLTMRSGIHTGELERRSGDVAGIAVHIGSRVASLAGADEIYVSNAVPPLVLGSGFEFEERGAHELKGIPGRWELLAVR